MRFLDQRGRVFVYGRPTDMRKGFTGLQALVLQNLGEDPLSGDLFIFVNRRKDVHEVPGLGPHRLRHRFQAP